MHSGQDQIANTLTDHPHSSHVSQHGAENEVNCAAAITIVQPNFDSPINTGSHYRTSLSRQLNKNQIIHKITDRI